MTTGAAWHIEEDPAWEIVKPWAWFDKDDVIDIPMSWVDWLADKGTTYGSHTIVVSTGLECVQSSESAGVVTIRIRKDPAGPDLVDKFKYAFTCRMVGANGEKQDRTLYLKVGVT